MGVLKRPEEKLGSEGKRCFSIPIADIAKTHGRRMGERRARPK